MFVSVSDHLFLALGRITEQLDKLYNTDLLFGETQFKEYMQPQTRTIKIRKVLKSTSQPHL